MGINDAVDKWKWLAINTMDHTLPRLHTLLDKLSQAVDPLAASFIDVKDHTLPRVETLLDKLSQAFDPIATRSLIEQTKAAISVIKVTSAALSLLLIIIFAVTIIFLHTSIKHSTQSFHLNYVRLQYGGTIETMARTYANLMKLHFGRVQRNGIGIGAERINVLLIGASETAEAYLRYDREFSSDEILRNLLPQEGQPFVFRTIKDALHTLDVCCTSEKKLPKTLFVLLLISTRDPSQDRHEHETFQMPSSLRDHHYAIVGTGMGDNGIPAHKLSKTSKGPNGELLTMSLPLGPKNAGVCF